MSQECVVAREPTGPRFARAREGMRTVASGGARRRLLKSRDGIPPPRPRPSGVDVAHEARIARRRVYPVTLVYTAYALAVFALGLRESAATTLSWAAAGVCSWPLIEYLFHRHVLHGRFADGEGLVRRTLHVWLDSLHAEHHERGTSTELHVLNGEADLRVQPLWLDEVEQCPLGIRRGDDNGRLKRFAIRDNAGHCAIDHRDLLNARAAPDG